MSNYSIKTIANATDNNRIKDLPFNRMHSDPFETCILLRTLELSSSDDYHNDPKKAKF